ncbi:hypothetical protein CBOM_03010 [Ceraceosorus bombacis]|uniref:Uncharacterized protein n=1 Tax=Ceraceosorus bombacis TaxID=401625 RepID=A0A0P1BMR1_9BASI|nr:hypothetical protein CBOM_03010 [Ceraceosorus bombacis]
MINLEAAAAKVSDGHLGRADGWKTSETGAAKQGDHPLKDELLSRVKATFPASLGYGSLAGLPKDVGEAKRFSGLLLVT